ncbi:hypothetical protein ACFX5K_04030 [Rickettsiales bacterium LUAb2]
MLHKILYKYFYITSTLSICLIILLSGCSKNYLYITSDNYNQDYYDYFGNLSSGNKKFDLTLVLDEYNININNIHNNLSLVRDNAWKVNDLYAIVLYSTADMPDNECKQIYLALDNIQSYLKQSKQFNNTFYIIGMPSLSINKCKAFLYLSNKESKIELTKR